MSAAVNLLPPVYAERILERRWAKMVAGALLVLLALLGLLAFVQGRRLRDAEAERAAEQVRTQQLTTRRIELLPFRELAEGVVQRERLLSATMQDQVSWASVLAGLSAVFPPDATLISFSAESRLSGSSEVPPAPSGIEAPVIGTVTFNGYATFDAGSVEEFSSGVSATLQALSGVAGLSEPQLVLGARGEIGEVPVTDFEGRGLLDGRALTGRYAQGLPAGQRVEVPGSPARLSPAGTGGVGTGAGQ